LSLFLLGGAWYWGDKNNSKESSSSLDEKNAESEEQANQENSSSQRQNEEEKRAEDWLKKCEAGETIFLAEGETEKAEEISGKISIDYLDDQEAVDYFLLGKAEEKVKFFGADWTEIDLLEGRQVLLRGEKKDGIFSPFSLRCLTSVSEKNTLEYRRKVMAEVTEKIGEISGERGGFVVESFWWQNDDYFYVDFFDEKDEDVYFEALVFVKKDGEKNSFERVALFKNSGEEEDLELISGRDLFEDAEDPEEEEEGNYYEFDESLKMWTPVY